jgi:hypothetical protein
MRKALPAMSRMMLRISDVRLMMVCRINRRSPLVR